MNIKEVGIIGNGSLSGSDKTIHIHSQSELTRENIEQWTKDGITIVIIDSSREDIKFSVDELKPMAILPVIHDPCAFIENVVLNERKQRKDHYRAIQKQHSFKNNNYKRFR